MTPEQVQSAIDGLRANFEKTDRGLSGWLEGIGATVADNRQLYLAILTQALEIAKGDKVVVPREPTQEMIDVGIEQIAFGNDFMDAYEAMIAVAEGEK
jgi:hypothetical protein